MLITERHYSTPAICCMSKEGIDKKYFMDRQSGLSGGCSKFKFVVSSLQGSFVMFELERRCLTISPLQDFWKNNVLQ